MSQIIPLTTVEARHENVISWINQQLSFLGLIVRLSFDLQVAKSAHAGCTCPYHGTEQCDCQVVMLLVYGNQEAPITLVVHSRDGKTYLSMTKSPEIGDPESLAGKIIHTLGHQNIKTS